MPSSVPSSGGQYVFTLTTGANCAWTARSDATWADVSPGSGQGSATPALRVAENPRLDDTRTLTLTINTQTFRVTQGVTSCSYTLSAYGLEARNEGGRLELRVNTTAGCAWTATTTENWIAITPRSGTGGDYVYLDISANRGDARQGVVTIAGQRVNVTQPRG